MFQPFTEEEKEILKHPPQSLPIGKYSRSVMHALACRKKIQTKLPSWYDCLDIQYPQNISLEQASSESTAAYKAALFPFQSLVDLTGGFGVDTFHFSKRGSSVMYVERNPDLVAIAKYNFAALGASNIEVRVGDGLEILKEGNMPIDCIYLDPARRSAAGGKTISLHDYEPNVLTSLDQLLHHAKKVMIKTSPMLDIHQALRDLHAVESVHVVAVNNECKEVVYVLDREVTQPPFVHCVDTVLPDHRFTFSFEEEAHAKSSFALPGKFVLEPHVTLLKAGAFKLVGERYGLQKLHQHTHLYTTNELPEYFMGRRFEVFAQLPVNRKQLQAFLGGKKANLNDP
jgi:precorrin-6B methylase 2